MANAQVLTADQMAQLQALAGREPDTQDIPEAPEENWRHAQRGAGADAIWEAHKEPISLRVDKDVLDWLRRQGPGYQTTINRILHERMETDR